MNLFTTIWNQVLNKFMALQELFIKRMSALSDMVKCFNEKCSAMFIDFESIHCFADRSGAQA